MVKIEELNSDGSSTELIPYNAEGQLVSKDSSTVAKTGFGILLVSYALKSLFDGIVSYLKGEFYDPYFSDNAKRVESQTPTKFTAEVAQFLSTYGKAQITSLRVFRKPLTSSTSALADYITNGKISEYVKNHPQDKLFHLGMVINGRHIFQKGQNINITTITAGEFNKHFQKIEGDTAEILDIPMQGKVFTYDDMINNAKKLMGDNKFFGYSALRNNCQNFIKNLIEGVGLITPDIASWIMIDTTELIKFVGNAAINRMQVITTLGSVVDHYYKAYLKWKNENSGIHKGSKPFAGFSAFKATKERFYDDERGGEHGSDNNSEEYSIGRIIREGLPSKTPAPSAQPTPTPPVQYDPNDFLL